MKNPFEKYYTSPAVAHHCWCKAIEIIGEENISESIEPSVGSGAFLRDDYLSPVIGYDVRPGCSSTTWTRVVQQDYLKLAIPYKEGRLIIGNPPFGERMNKARGFYKKAVMQGDYVAFILPISQLNNRASLYEFDLIYSEDLGIQLYSGQPFHCCFNVYKRPDSGKLNQKAETKLKDISIFRKGCNGYTDLECDVRICYWGNGTAGKILVEGESYSAEYKIQVHNPDVVVKVIEVLREYDWAGHLKSIAMKTIPKFMLVNVLKEYIPEIQ